MNGSYSAVLIWKSLAVEGGGARGMGKGGGAAVGGCYVLWLLLVISGWGEGVLFTLCNGSIIIALALLRHC